MARCNINGPQAVDDVLPLPNTPSLIKRPLSLGPSSMLLLCVFGILFGAILASMYRGEAEERPSLKDIPSVAGSGWLRAWVFALMTPFRSHIMIAEGYRKWAGQLFKVPQLRNELLLVSGAYLDELLTIPERQFSFYAAVDELTQSKWIFGSQVLGNPFHGQLLLSKLNRDLQRVFPLLHGEIVETCNRNIGRSASEIHAFPFVLEAVARMSNRALGSFTPENEAELCRLSMDFTVEVVKASYILFAVPDRMKPLALRYFTRIPTYIARATELLRPSIQRRRKEPQNDMLSWILEAAPTDERTDGAVTIRVLHLIFASLHTTAMTFTHALYHIAARREYVRPLREEIAAAVEDGGWSKASIDQMVKLDSFMQECQRYSPIGAIIMIRKVLESYQFSDGTQVPIGTTVAAPLAAIHMDDCHYPNATTFDGFRFCHSQADKTASMTAPSTTYLTFGRGKHTCPGRYLATLELKSFMAHLIYNYDIELPGRQIERPPDEWYSTNRVPNTKARLVFRPVDVSG